MSVERFTEVVKRYGAAWNGADEAAVGQILEAVWAEDGTYTDPTAYVEGREALRRHIREFRQRWPGAKLVFASDVDAHHHWLRFAWRIVGADGKTMGDGVDIGEIDDSLRLRRIVGFFGPLQSL